MSSGGDSFVQQTLTTNFNNNEQVLKTVDCSLTVKSVTNVFGFKADFVFDDEFLENEQICCPVRFRPCHRLGPYAFNTIQYNTIQYT